ncbi:MULTISPECIES: hypothetical protein [unclassified Clostridioides]|uniref:hypothetical protein n=1 Tax=unclassified Clostridioides TaxID=2635829 RepID=UPI001D12C9B3|nr:hypothetical protein [Clostridioides sp. ZZV15-6388]MCC0643916.1 hypothetical protein [Clostridioides sp. ZZV14-6150]MCC0659620.1 hypothetical protein [Clostridioides sp. ZZV14-6154]MCC0663834.1 hypothetical protein [Clostridioides sp. ZZV15-6597]MCC0666869.1 hypothetical protein [Clostridioides sp. ZZV14-6153]MCC0719371.1 hypothetical protein [Clostridioides sp. ZZV14-6105]MCC0722986.1 hypothetical protein [Clostridioides sp. ZZV14-6104]MCC0725828.1 hypothetical protein [Clostridioides s
MCKLDSEGVIECCRAIDDFITALNGVRSLNMEKLDILTKYSTSCSILLREENYKGCTIVYKKMLEELKT